MLKIQEDLLHFVWKNKLFDSADLKDDSGNKIEIQTLGMHNTDSGPDFFNANITIGGTLWAGNVEIHIKSSDWIKHKHHKDEAYDNVILQIVSENDMPIFRTNGEKIPCLELPLKDEILEQYAELMAAEHEIACKDQLHEIDSFSINSWLNALWAERIELKSGNISRILDYTNQNWEETFYINLARSFGSKINALPFELLAKSLPSKILAKHKSDLLQLEALLFGQAGFLVEDCADNYFLKLKQEYAFLQKKYQLKKIDTHLWKFLRLRPPGFPTVRLSQFAALIHKSSHLFSKLINCEQIADIESDFSVSASSYWDTHYRFGKESSHQKKQFGKTAVRNVIINTLIPILFLYGQARDKPDLVDKAIRFSEILPAETNKITRLWDDCGIKSDNVFKSQSLIQLYNEYCRTKRCAECRIGGKLLAKSKT